MGKELSIDCECKNEILRVEKEDDENEFWLVVYRYCPLRYSLKRRIKFLFTGQIEFNEVIISKESAIKLRDFLTANT
jgi:hypothetical protein